MRIPCFQVDAFTREPFRGNPAAVCPLDEWLDDAVLQAIAEENALSETAFFVPGDDGAFTLRWFTPATEVDLCGHATLATALVLMTELGHERSSVRFHTRSGVLTVSRSGEAYVLDFPARPAAPVAVPAGLEGALGAAPPLCLQSTRDLLAVFPCSLDVTSLRVDAAKLAALPVRAVVVTAPGDGAHRDVDFVSRFFAPAMGVPEDPVTGSAHCALTPYWAERLGKTDLLARQVSRRQGELGCVLVGDRVHLRGHGVLVKTGTLHLDATPRPQAPGLALR